MGTGHGHHGHLHHHHHGPDAGIRSSREGMRAVWISLVILGATAALQLVVFLASGSVALLADLVHNVGDALTALPLAAAFFLARRPPTERFTYGFHRAEDLAGIAVVVLIFGSGVFALYESIARLFNPAPPGALWAVAIAGLIGAAGNELAAYIRIRTGRRIGSAALVADGMHARTDGLISLAVVVGAAGVALGWDLADPIVGILIGLVIMQIVWQSAVAVGRRALDGIEPGTVQAISRAASAVDGVVSVSDVRARWLGHHVQAELTITCDRSLDLAQGHTVAESVEHALLHEIDHLAGAVVHVHPTPP